MRPTLLPEPERRLVTGLVLSGGLGRRMSDDGRGVDKGLLPLRGQPMIRHAISRLAPQVGALLVNANGRLADYARFGYPVVQDDPAGFVGPLAGLHAAMATAATPWIVTVPCDSPFLPNDLVARLWQALDPASSGGTRPAIACTADGRRHPVFALVPRGLRAQLAAYLADGQRRVDDWYRQQQAVAVRFDNGAAFDNLNTPEAMRARQ